MVRSIQIRLFSLLILVLSTAAALGVEVECAPEQGVVALEQASLDLSNDLTILSFAAHPDDEDGETLAYYRKKYGFRAVTLLATRGEGGQNEIGPELYRELGVIRTRESEAAASLIGSEVYYMNFYDFGYSKSPEEAFEKWGGRYEVISALTKMLRVIRPDIIITNHGAMIDHGHHQACGIAILEAIDLAAKSGFTTGGLAPHQTAKLYIRRPEGSGPLPGALAEASVNTGEFDALRGLTYSEIALAALRRHRSQGLWPDDVWKGPNWKTFDLAKSSVDAKPIEDGLADGLKQRKVELCPAFDVPNPAIAGYGTGSLVEAYGQEMSRAEKAKDAPEQSFILEQRAGKIARLLTLKNRIHVRGTLERDVVAPGTHTVRIQAFNGGDLPVHIKRAAITSAWIPDLEAATSAIGTLMPGESRETELQVSIPLRSNPIYTHPASETWHKKSQYRPLFNLQAEAGFGGPEGKTFLTPPVPVDAELRRPIEIEVDPPDIAAILGAGKTVELTVRARNNTQLDIEGLQVGFLDPFSGEPRKSGLISLAKNGGQAIADGMTLKPRKTSLPGVYPIKIECKLAPRNELPGLQVLAPNAVEARVHLLSVTAAPGLKVGLIETYDDAHARALRTLGVDFERIDPAMLRGGDLSRFDTILLSLRAYHDREDAVSNNVRLLDYVKHGGNLICTYNKTFEWNREDGANYAPFPIVLGRDRVTREEAPMTILKPDHPQFNFPNRVTHADLEGWAQERCLYLPAQWDGRYEELIECHDPGESEHRGGHLTARYGEGTYTYTCFVWYRQLRHINPGAYKMFANVISQPRFQDAGQNGE